MARTRLFLEWLVILGCTMLVTWWAGEARLTERLDHQLLDFATARTLTPADDRILLVAIDDASLAQVGQWPWDRRQVATLIDRLAEGGARTIALDVLFPEPSQPEADAALAQALARAGNVVLPYTFAAAPNQVNGSVPLEPLPELRRAAAGTGHAAIFPDTDGVVRRIPTVFSEAGVHYPHLQLAVYRAALGEPPVKWPALEPPGDSVLPIRPAGAYRSVPAANVIRGEVPAAFLRDKIVLVGATAAGLGDSFPVPSQSGSMMAGVEIQGNLLQALIEDSFITPLATRTSLWIAAAAIGLLFLGFWRLRPAWCLVLAVSLALGSVLFAFLLVETSHRWFAPGSLLLGLIVAYPLWGWRRLAAVSDFLDARARKLAPEAVLKPTLVGFDSVARQASLLGHLVDEVSERREFLQNVIDAAPDAVCAFDGDGRLRLSNAHAEAIFGDAGLGQTLPELIAGARASLSSDGNELALANGHTLSLTGTDSVPHKDLQVVVLADVTEARRTETERREMLEFLSHDMRAPQVAILGLTGTEPGAESMVRIERHARRTLKLADDFVQLARLAEAPHEPEEVDLGALLDEAIDRAHPSAKGKDIAIRSVVPHEPVCVLADGAVLSRALDNLLGNALTYSPRGSEVALDLIVRGGNAVLEIADRGPGLPDARRTDPFRRFGASGGAGAGLGLAFVRRAVERQGGRIDCRSGPDGTRFTITLPKI